MKSRLLKRVEKQVYPQCDLLVVCSETDAQVLEDTFAVEAARIIVVPNGISQLPSEDPTPAPLCRSRDESVLLFLGKLDYRPNREAVEWLFDKLLPELGSVPFPLCLTIVGGPVPTRLPERVPENVRLLLPGKVPEIAPYLAAADICLAPLFSGSGTRIKILEFLSAGRALLATEKAAEGLSLEPGRHYERIESAEAAAKSIERLIQNPEQRSALGACGKDFVKTHYLWKPLVEQYYSELQARVQSGE